MQVKKQLKKVEPKEQKQIAGGGWPVWTQEPIGQCPNPDLVIK